MTDEIRFTRGKLKAMLNAYVHISDLDGLVEHVIEHWALASPISNTGAPGYIKHWNDPSLAIQEQAEEFLRRSGIRDLVIRHEGQPNEQRLSHLLAFFAANPAPPEGERKSVVQMCREAGIEVAVPAAVPEGVSKVGEGDDGPDRSKEGQSPKHRLVTSSLSNEPSPAVLALNDLLKNRTCSCGGWTCPRCILSISEAHDLIDRAALGEEAAIRPATGAAPTVSTGVGAASPEKLLDVIGGLVATYETSDHADATAEGPIHPSEDCVICWASRVVGESGFSTQTLAGAERETGADGFTESGEVGEQGREFRPPTKSVEYSASGKIPATEDAGRGEPRLECMHCARAIEKCDGLGAFCGCKGWFHINVGNGPSHVCYSGSSTVAEPAPAPAPRPPAEGAEEAATEIVVTRMRNHFSTLERQDEEILAIATIIRKHAAALPQQGEMRVSLPTLADAAEIYRQWLKEPRRGEFESDVEYNCRMIRFALTSRSGAAPNLKGETMNQWDVEAISAEVHNAWMKNKLAKGITSRKLESGEELMVPYEQLSEEAKELDRGSVQAVLQAIDRIKQTLVTGAERPGDKEPLK